VRPTNACHAYAGIRVVRRSASVRRRLPLMAAASFDFVVAIFYRWSARTRCVHLRLFAFFFVAFVLL